MTITLNGTTGVVAPEFDGPLDASNLTGALPAIDGSALTGITSTPASTVIYVAQNTAPTGYVKANGAALSRTTYADLFAAIGTTFGSGDGSTTFNVPDLRGEFIRAWDDARGVDSGRSFGSAQAHRTEDLYAQVAGNYPYTRLKNTSTPYWTSNYRDDDYGANEGAVGQSKGAGVEPRNTGETRPRNIALLACIKY